MQLPRQPIVPLVYDVLTQDQENTEILPNVLNLLVNITSHDDIIICEYNLRAIPQILSLYTPQINVSFWICLSSAFSRDATDMLLVTSK